MMEWLKRFVMIMGVAWLVSAVPLRSQIPRPIPTEDEEEEAAPRREALPEDRGESTKAPAPPPPPVLLLTSDMNCRVEIDGEEKALLMKDVAQEIRVKPGERLLQAFPLDIEDGPTWKDTVKIPDTGQVVALIELGELVDDWEEGLKAEEAEGRFVVQNQVIIDNESKLAWESTTVRDIKWSEARSLCSHKKVGTTTGWRLPTVQELSTLYWPDHPEPRHEASEGETTSKFWGMVKTKGPMEVAPVLIYRPFEKIPRLSSIWVSDEKVSCSFVGELQCSGGQKKGDALCVRSNR